MSNQCHTSFLDASLSQSRYVSGKQVGSLRLFWLSCLDFWRFNTEPRIQDVTADAGKVFWRVFDPKCDHVLWFESKEQVLDWLERRHQRRS